MLISEVQMRFLLESMRIHNNNNNNNKHLDAIGVTTRIELLQKAAGVLTIYTGKPEIPVGKSNGSRHSVWEASENMGCNKR